MTSRSIAACLIAGVAGAIAGLAGVSIAQTAPTRAAASYGDPRREALERLMKPVTVELTDARLEDVFKFIEDVGGVSLDAQWLEGSFSDGLERDSRVSVKVEGASLLALLEVVLAKAQTGGLSENAWQLTTAGGVQVGPKSRLNRYAFVKLYDINDLLFEVPSFESVPELDLDAVLNQRQGGGSGSIFQQEGDNEVTRDPEQKAQDIISILIANVEFDQWQDNGGDGATVRFYNGALLVRAPDYIHRQIGGYPFWPQTEPTAAVGGAYRVGRSTAGRQSAPPAGASAGGAQPAGGRPKP